MPVEMLFSLAQKSAGCTRQQQHSFQMWSCLGPHGISACPAPCRGPHCTLLNPMHAAQARGGCCMEQFYLLYKLTEGFLQSQI